MYIKFVEKFYKITCEGDNINEDRNIFNDYLTRFLDFFWTGDLYRRTFDVSSEFVLFKLK